MRPEDLAAPRRPRAHGMALWEMLFLRAADALTARIPTAPPPPEAWRSTCIVAHRGIHDNQHVFENTLDAFEAARAAGIWGLECDVRWTRDHTAIVHHDPDGQRLFGLPTPIAALTWHELQRVYPLIPRLDTVVARYGRQLHLMIEIKAADHTPPDQINRTLADALEPLDPGRDFHIMSMSLDLLGAVEALPRRACLPIAGLNVRAASQAVATRGYGGLTGHYALIGRRRIAALHRRERHVGTGFINSRGCLLREVARGVDWLFTDQALALQRLVRRATGLF